VVLPGIATIDLHVTELLVLVIAKNLNAKTKTDTFSPNPKWQKPHNLAWFVIRVNKQYL
jgi:hypothetical protein